MLMSAYSSADISDGLTTARRGLCHSAGRGALQPGRRGGGDRGVNEKPVGGASVYAGDEAREGRHRGSGVVRLWRSAGVEEQARMRPLWPVDVEEGVGGPWRTRGRKNCAAGGAWRRRLGAGARCGWRRVEATCGGLGSDDAR